MLLRNRFVQRNAPPPLRRGTRNYCARTPGSIVWAMFANKSWHAGVVLEPRSIFQHGKPGTRIILWIAGCLTNRVPDSQIRDFRQHFNNVYNSYKKRPNKRWKEATRRALKEFYGSDPGYNRLFKWARKGFPNFTARENVVPQDLLDKHFNRVRENLARKKRRMAIRKGRR